MRRLLPAALALLTGCPGAQVTPPPDVEPPAIPVAIATWLSCAAELGFEATPARVVDGGHVEVAVRPPPLHALSARPADDADARALSWYTPVPSGTWELRLAGGADGDPTLEAFAPGAFLDAQRLLVVSRRCGSLTLGDAVHAAFAGGPPEDAATRGAARLVVAACESGPRCPEGWRARLLDLAAVHPAASAPRFADQCGASAPPSASDAPPGAARDLRAWVLDEVGPAPDQSVVSWARELSARALGSGEAILRAAFEAHREAGKPAAAARLVDEAMAAALGISERLRYDGALAWRDAGERDTAAARLEALAGEGRTVYADFARRALSELPR